MALPFCCEFPDSSDINCSIISRSIVKSKLLLLARECYRPTEYVCILIKDESSAIIKGDISLARARLTIAAPLPSSSYCCSLWSPTFCSLSTGSMMPIDDDDAGEVGALMVPIELHL